MDGHRPVDPRLARLAPGIRRAVTVATGTGAVAAVLVVAQAWLVAVCVSGAVVDHDGLARLRAPLTLLVAVVVARAVVRWGSELAAHRVAASATSSLRQAVVERVAALGPRGIEDEGAGRLAVLATSGIDAVDAYVARYLPQLLLAVIVPVTVVVAVAGADWVSAVLIGVTVPLIPVFMALVGATTADRTARRAAHLHRLAGHFLDVVGGLPTLKVFGRAKAQAATVREVADRYRTATMDTLRVAFLSALVLELLATVSVAVVAVAVGLRLLGGHLDLEQALFVLVLAPEAYLPLRELGTAYHDGAAGMEAAGRCADLLDRPLPPRGVRTAVPDPATSTLEVDGLTVTYDGRRGPALPPVCLTVAPGETVAVVGPSGCGKSTLLGVVLGLVTPTAGAVRCGGVDLADLDPDAWRARLAWVPQHPHLFARSVADNIRLGRAGATDAEVAAATEAAGLGPVVAGLPRGLDTVLGPGGAGLSVGERRRVAVARAFVRDAPLLLLDEPTAGLDGETEAGVAAAVRRLAAGRTVVVVAHRPTLVGTADRVVDLGELVVGVR